MKRNGFSLVEIMVVVGILGFLAIVAGLAIGRGIQGSHKNQATAELNMLSTAVLQLAWDTGKWPNGQLRINGGSIEKWELSSGTCGLKDTDGNYSHWKGPYYEGNLKDPWGNPYFFDPDYKIEGINHVVVGSFGPNGGGRNLYDSDDIYVLLDD